MPEFSPEHAREIARRIAVRRPRVHVLTNPVAQALSANALVALGAAPSMSSHPDDILPLASASDAILVNLGMLEPKREAAITSILGALDGLACPLVLDPVMADRVPFRRDLAGRYFNFPRLIVKGNAAEIAALAPQLPTAAIRVTTGEEDRIECGGQRFSCRGGHTLMARFSGSGCLAGALIAAFSSVEPDLVTASAAALSVLRLSAARAGAQASGPGTFVPLLLDALAETCEA